MNDGHVSFRKGNDEIEKSAIKYDSNDELIHEIEINQ